MNLASASLSTFLLDQDSAVLQRTLALEWFHASIMGREIQNGATSGSKIRVAARQYQNGSWEAVCQNHNGSWEAIRQNHNDSWEAFACSQHFQTTETETEAFQLFALESLV